MSERSGVEIDFCPQCRGVWLDRGELDKIVERSASYDRGGRFDDDDRGGFGGGIGGDRGYDRRGRRRDDDDDEGGIGGFLGNLFG